jgi:transposase-like protein
MSDPFRYFNSSPEVIRLVVMMYAKYPLSLRNVEDLLAERGIFAMRRAIRNLQPEQQPHLTHAAPAGCPA